MKRKMKKMLAFTLIELMITVAIVAVLAAIGYPSYTDYVIRAKRGDAKSTLLGAQLAQEKWRANNVSYTNALTNLGFTEVDSKFYSTDGNYEITISGTPNATTYTILATPVDSFTDSRCGVFAVDQAGKAISSTQDSIAKVQECWGK